MRLTLSVLCVGLLLHSTVAARTSENENGEWDVASGSSAESYEEQFSLYGYMVDYFQASTNVTRSSFSEPSYGNALLLRLKGDWRPERNLRFHLECNYLNSLGNQNPYVLLGKTGLLTYKPSDYPLEDFTQRLYIDHAWGLVNLGSIDLQFGKFPIAWGTGYVFNPTARVSIPPFLDMVTEDTPGAAAVMTTYTFSERLSLQGYLAFQDRTQKRSVFKEDGQSRNLPYGLKLKTIIGGYDLSVCWLREVIYNELDLRPLDTILEEAARTYLQGIVAEDYFSALLASGDTLGAINLFKQSALAQMSQTMPPNQNYLRRYYWGLDFAGAVGNWGVYGEFALRIPKSATGEHLSLSRYRVADHLEAVLGCDYNLSNFDLQARFEYFYQGTGVKRKQDYNLLMALSGERLVMARNYAMFFLEKTPNDYHKLSLAFFANLDDGSFALLPMYNFLPYDNFELTAGAFVLSGKKGAEFDGRYNLYGVKTIDLFDNLWPYVRLKISF